MAREARERGVHGVVCGHIHHAELRDIDGILYANDGDWVESLTALVEHADGRLEIIDWSARAARRAAAIGQQLRAAGAPRRSKRRMKIALVTDAWLPQVNGVVTTLLELRQRPARARPRGAADRAVGLPPLSLPRLSRDRAGVAAGAAGARSGSTASRPTRSTSPPKARSAAPRARYCLRRGLAFTTAFHTRFPDILAQRAAHPRALGLCLVHALPCAVVGRDGADRRHARHPARPRLRQPAARGRTASTCACSSRWPAPTSACRGRCSCTSAACRTRRTSRPS